MIIFEGIDNFRALFTRENYFNIRGRVNRRTYWTTWLIYTIVCLLSYFAFYNVLPGLYAVIVFLMAIPMLCLEVRRLHDTGHSGKLIVWLLALCFAGIVCISLALGSWIFRINYLVFDSITVGSYVSPATICFLAMGCLLFLACFILDIVIFVFLLTKGKDFSTKGRLISMSSDSPSPIDSTLADEGDIHVDNAEIIEDAVKADDNEIKAESDSSAENHNGFSNDDHSHA